MMTESEISSQRASAVAGLRAANPKWDFSKANNENRRLNPHLYGLPPRGAQPEVSNRAPRTTVGEDSERRELVAEIQSKNPKMTFNRAWQLARSQNPSLFGLSVLS